MDISCISPELNNRHASSYDNAPFARPRVAWTFYDRLRTLGLQSTCNTLHNGCVQR